MQESLLQSYVEFTLLLLRPFQMWLQVSEPEEAAASSTGGSSSAPTLAAGIEFSMPTQDKVSAEVLAAQGVGKVEAGVDDLMAQLSALNKK
jgi:hypothetical protein